MDDLVYSLNIWAYFSSSSSYLKQKKASITLAFLNRGKIN